MIDTIKNNLANIIRQLLKPFILLAYNTFVISHLKKYAFKHPRFHFWLLKVRKRLISNPALHTLTDSNQKNDMTAQKIMTLVDLKLKNNVQQASILYLREHSTHE